MKFQKLNKKFFKFLHPHTPRNLKQNKLKINSTNELSRVNKRLLYKLNTFTRVQNFTTVHTYVNVRLFHGVEQSEEGALLRGPPTHHIPAPHAVLPRPHGRVAPNLTTFLRVTLVDRFPKHLEIKTGRPIQGACHTVT